MQRTGCQVSVASATPQWVRWPPVTRNLSRTQARSPPQGLAGIAVSAVVVKRSHPFAKPAMPARSPVWTEGGFHWLC